MSKKIVKRKDITTTFTCDSGIIKKGTNLLIEKPFVSVPLLNKKHEICDNCFTSRQDLKKCTVCKYVYYCDASCQRKSWSLHKVECPCLLKVERDITSTLHLLLRILIKLNTDGGKNQRSYYGKNVYRTFDSLMSHKDQIAKDADRMEYFLTLFYLLQSFDFDIKIDGDALLEIFGKVCINTTCVLDRDMNVVGSAIYLAGSSLNHSCDPNSCCIFYGNSLHVRNVVDMPNFKWDNIRISYVELLASPESIRNQLQRYYYFVCDCVRCTSDVRHNSVVNSVICTNGSCKDLVEISLENKDDEYVCSKCKTVLNQSLIHNYSKILDETNSVLKSIESSEYPVEKSYKMLKQCYRNQKGIFSSLNLYKVKTRDKLFDMGINLYDYDHAIDVGYKLIPGFREYYGHYNPIVTMAYCKLIGVLGLVNKTDKTIVRDCLDAVSITYGERHPLYAEMLDMIRTNIATAS